MWICKHCQQEFDYETFTKKANHSKWCYKNPNKQDNTKAIEAMRLSKENIEHTNQFSKAKLLGLPIPKGNNFGKKGLGKGRKHSEESKKKMSNCRKDWLRNNPDKHPWKKNSKFTSAPCELLKTKLTENNISFVPEYCPLAPDHFYSVDIAFPDKKIAIEINGNQHYNSDKTLKPYYQKRHDLLEEAGWKVLEIHYSIVYTPEINTIIETLKINS